MSASFIQTFVEILQDYFGVMSAATLRDHFDVVYQVGPSSFDGTLNRLMPHSCPKRPWTIEYPSIVSPNQLRTSPSHVAAPEDLGRNWGGGAGEFWTWERHSLPSSIPWRKVGLRYNNNEIYFNATVEPEAAVDPYVHFLPVTTTGVDL